MAFEAEVDVPAVGGSFAGSTTQRGRTPGGRFNGDGISGFVQSKLSETTLWIGPNAPAGDSYLLWMDTDTNILYVKNAGVWVAAEAQAALHWDDYAINWSATPTLAGTTTEGDVYLYTYDNGTAYRLVPTDGISSDGFYQTFSGSVLSDLIIERGLVI